MQKKPYNFSKLKRSAKILVVFEEQESKTIDLQTLLPFFILPNECAAADSVADYLTSVRSLEVNTAVHLATIFYRNLFLSIVEEVYPWTIEEDKQSANAFNIFVTDDEYHRIVSDMMNFCEQLFTVRSILIDSLKSDIVKNNQREIPEIKEGEQITFSYGTKVQSETAKGIEQVLYEVQSLRLLTKEDYKNPMNIYMVEHFFLLVALSYYINKLEGGTSKLNIGLLDNINNQHPQTQKEEIQHQAEFIFSCAKDDFKNLESFEKHLDWIIETVEKNHEESCYDTFSLLFTASYSRLMAIIHTFIFIEGGVMLNKTYGKASSFIVDEGYVNDGKYSVPFIAGFSYKDVNLLTITGEVIAEKLFGQGEGELKLVVSPYTMMITDIIFDEDKSSKFEIIPEIEGVLKKNIFTDIENSDIFDDLFISNKAAFYASPAFIYNLDDYLNLNDEELENRLYGLSDLQITAAFDLHAIINSPKTQEFEQMIKPSQAIYITEKNAICDYRGYVN